MLGNNYCIAMKVLNNLMLFTMRLKPFSYRITTLIYNFYVLLSTNYGNNVFFYKFVII